jgi:hypothetical protein
VGFIHPAPAAREFLGHSLIEALAAGQLFTPPIRRLG